MSFLNFINCSNFFFSQSDYNQNILTIENVNLHNNQDNAWIVYNNNVYSIQKNDDFLLNLFNQFYGKDVSDFLSKLENNERKIILNKLKTRFIGKLKF